MEDSSRDKRTRAPARSLTRRARGSTSALLRVVSAGRLRVAFAARVGVRQPRERLTRRLMNSRGRAPLGSDEELAGTGRPDERLPAHSKARWRAHKPLPVNRRPSFHLIVSRAAQAVALAAQNCSSQQQVLRRARGNVATSNEELRMGRPVRAAPLVPLRNLARAELAERKRGQRQRKSRRRRQVRLRVATSSRRRWPIRTSRQPPGPSTDWRAVSRPPGGAGHAQGRLAAGLSLIVPREL